MEREAPGKRLGERVGTRVARLFERTQPLLPDVAQKVIEGSAIPAATFYYMTGAWLYITDGPHHDGRDENNLDNESRLPGHGLGLTALRFRYDNKEEWDHICANHAYVFGKVKALQYHPIGSLIQACGREWVVHSDSEDDFLVLRPLGGTDLRQPVSTRTRKVTMFGRLLLTHLEP